ncbi:hypothetical protein [Rhizobium sp. NXC14]|uniref:hypothetical protein n=1 Tax=Rhizobium sp. NXC14 TaxID=1981173 RepID=UPI0012F4817F|nr:hypothetical protein [Rhizobium sp. NXC14]
MKDDRTAIGMQMEREQIEQLRKSVGCAGAGDLGFLQSTSEHQAGDEVSPRK